MLQGEHSAILLTCIKRQLVLKTNFGIFESGGFTQVLLYVRKVMKLDASIFEQLFPCTLHCTYFWFVYKNLVSALK